MASPRRIDVHFHLIPPFYREAVYVAGRGPALGKHPDWTPELALDVMDAHGIEVALTSLAQPGVGFGSEASAQALARRCNDYAAELVVRIHHIERELWRPIRIFAQRRASACRVDRLAVERRNEVEVNVDPAR